MIAEFSITPVGAGVSIGAYVAKAVQIVHDSGVKYELNPMGTVVEGDWDRVMAVIKRCHDELLKECERLSIVVKIDARRGPQPPMEEKVRSVKARLRT
ncbi:MAG: MTH1187 family thiamine-binding protein [Euryarchaeota archaeon]|nr:MTH1187 family thiamine-binding protein [Euryarchaeota archaeon]